MLHIMPGMPIRGKVGITQDKNSLLSAWEQTDLFSYLHKTKTPGTTHTNKKIREKTVRKKLGAFYGEHWQWKLRERRQTDGQWEKKAHLVVRAAAVWSLSATPISTFSTDTLVVTFTSTCTGHTHLAIQFLTPKHALFTLVWHPGTFSTSHPDPL